MTAQDDTSVCAAMVREYDFPRYAATLFTPLEKRQALLALAAFDLEISRIPDQVSQPLPGEIRLQWWSDLLEGTEHGGAAGHPVAAELLAAIAAYALPVEPLRRAMRAHSFDLYDDAMPNRAAMNIYLDDTVGEFMTASLRVLGGDASKQEPLIRDAGRALGLTRMIARLPHDAARRRCFLPNDAMVEFGLTREALYARVDTPALRALRDELIAAARQHLANAQWRLKQLDPALRQAFLPLATLGRELDAMSSSAPLVLHVPPSRLRVLWTMWLASKRTIYSAASQRARLEG